MQSLALTPASSAVPARLPLRTSGLGIAAAKPDALSFGRIKKSPTGDVFQGNVRIEQVLLQDADARRGPQTPIGKALAAIAAGVAGAAMLARILKI